MPEDHAALQVSFGYLHKMKQLRHDNTIFSD